MNRFKVENETVLDTKTNLMWMQNSLEEEFTFAEAINIKKEFAGFDDWRLPTIDELVAIINYQAHPAYFEGFMSTESSSTLFYFWSSSPYVGNPSYYAWSVNFNGGFVGLNHRNGAFPVRLVRHNGLQENTETV